MDLYCPQCQKQLRSADMNLPEGVALCPSCGTLTRLSTLLGVDAGGQSGAVATAGDEDWRNLPKGCRVTGWPGDVTLRASTRSIVGALFLLFFTVFWNSILSIFVVGMLAGFYQHLVGPLPAWLNKIGPIKSSHNMPLSMCFFMLVFLTPFVLVGVATALGMLTSLFGDVRLRVFRDDASVSTGIGFLRWKRKFNASAVTEVNIGLTTWSQNNQRKPVITIETAKTIRFGSMLSKARRQWLASAGKLVLMTPNSSDVSDLLALGRSGSPNEFAPAPFPTR